jgi:hypothetical protein
LIPKQKDVILAVGPNRHLSLSEIIQAICLEKSYGRFYRQIFCNTYWIAWILGWLKVSGNIEKYKDPDKSFDRPHYRLTPKGERMHSRLFATSKLTSPHWAQG